MVALLVHCVYALSQTQHLTIRLLSSLLVFVIDLPVRHAGAAVETVTRKTLFSMGVYPGRSH